MRFVQASIVFLAALCCAAQQPLEIEQTNDSATLAITWLRGADPVHKAWAIYLVRRGHLTFLIPDLELLLRPNPPDLQLLALDALLQLNATVPDSELRGLTEQFPTEVLILAVKTPGDHSQLFMTLLDSARGLEAWTAVGNLLLPDAPAAFVHRLLSTIRVQIDIDFFDPEDPDREHVASGYGGSSAGSLFSDKKGWPPVGHYTLGEVPIPSALLAPGPHNVYYARTESAKYTDQGFEYTSEEGGRNRNERSQEYLAALLHVDAPSSPLQIHVAAVFNWTTPTALEADVTNVVRHQQVIFRMVAESLLPGEPPDMQTRIKVRMMDSRRQKFPALPDLTDLASTLNVDFVVEEP